MSDTKNNVGAKVDTNSKPIVNNTNTFIDKTGTKWSTVSFKSTKEDKLQLAVVYFKLLSSFNNLNLTDVEINLLSHISSNKGIVSGSCKINYSKKYQTSIASINNTISKLKRKKLLIKKDNIIYLHPIINIDFNNNDNFIFSFKCILKKTL